MTQQKHQSNPFHEWIRLEQPRLGSRVVFTTDDFFGAKERMIEPADAVFIADKYDEHGKWMDGWESRRKREPGHDFCIVRLGLRGIVHGIEIDTSHFTGNHAPAASLDGCSSDEDIPQDGWQEILSEVSLDGDSRAFFPIADEPLATHLRLNIYPDGGVARLRIYGEVRPDWSGIDSNTNVDLLALENGGRALKCSDEHFGSMHNLNVSGRGVNMGDGWETARRRGPGHDWVILALGTPGCIDRVVIDTAHFKGNYPDRAAIHAGLFGETGDGQLEPASEGWATLLPESRLAADTVHEYVDELASLGEVSHVRLSIYPDGGVSRLRLFGHLQSARARR
jgi:allantoicase